VCSERASHTGWTSALNHEIGGRNGSSIVRQSQVGKEGIGTGTRSASVTLADKPDRIVLGIHTY
jgi:hypothetical protein